MSLCIKVIELIRVQFQNTYPFNLILHHHVIFEQRQDHF